MCRGRAWVGSRSPLPLLELTFTFLPIALLPLPPSEWRRSCYQTSSRSSLPLHGNTPPFLPFLLTLSLFSALIPLFPSSFPPASGGGVAIRRHAHHCPFLTPPFLTSPSCFSSLCTVFPSPQRVEEELLSYVFTLITASRIHDGFNLCPPDPTPFLNVTSLAAHPNLVLPSSLHLHSEWRRNFCQTSSRSSLPAGFKTPSTSALPSPPSSSMSPSFLAPLIPSSPQRVEEELLSDAFTLITAGRIHDALNLCRAAGQTWRAAVLGGTWAAPPSAGAAGESFPTAATWREMSGGARRAAQAWEVEGGKGRGRRLWKWSLLVASEASTSRFEAALLGALCGNVKRILPVCTSWQVCVHA
ncbi:unnamed protein product [Closterium sp. NIES-53]